MNKILRDKKAGTPLSIILLVLLTICLILLTLYTFNSRQKDIKEVMNLPSQLDKVYTQEIEMNYYLQTAFDKACSNFSISDGKEKFADIFKNELNKLKLSNGKYLIEDIGQFEGVTASDIEINDFESGKKLVLNLNGKIYYDKTESRINLINIEYSYFKKFEKVFG